MPSGQTVPEVGDLPLSPAGLELHERKRHSRQTRTAREIAAIITSEPYGRRSHAVGHHKV